MHIYIKPKFLAICSKCKKPVLSHTVCKNCGFYKGKEVIDVLGKLTKKEKKQRKKEIATAEKETREEKPLSMEGLSKR